MAGETAAVLLGVGSSGGVSSGSGAGLECLSACLPARLLTGGAGAGCLRLWRCPQVMVQKGQLPFEFKDRPARIGVLPRYAKSADEIRWFSTGEGCV